jgi:rubrerythrin
MKFNDDEILEDEPVSPRDEQGRYKWVCQECGHCVQRQFNGKTRTVKCPACKSQALTVSGA